MPKRIEWKDKRVGRVKIISLVKRTTSGSTWDCLCDCGNGFSCLARSFKRGKTFECENCRFERKRGPDLTGRKYGRWTVIARSVDKRNKTVWHCKCDCGNEGYVSTSSLGKKGRSVSCGCWGRKMKSKFVNPSLYPPAHGLSGSNFYQIKTSLIHKCYNEKHPSFDKFGGKGITVCDLWLNGARDMHKWVVANGWEESDVICLKEGEKEFNPYTTIIIKESEFRSAVGKNQGHQVTYNGETHSVAFWAKLLDVSPATLRKRIYLYPSIDVVFNSVFRRCNFVRNPELKLKIIEMYNEGKRQCEIAREINESSQTVRYHLLKHGVTLRDNETKQHKLDYIKDETILEYVESGLSLNAIANKLNCSWPTIKNRLDNMNGVKRKR